MMMTASARKFALTAHVTSSVGWLGAAAGFLVLAITGLISFDAQLVMAAYLAMKLIGWYVIVPLSVASPLTGLALSLGTVWGVFKHYWVVAKILMTIPATVLLMVHMQPVGHLARVVAETTIAHGDLAGLRVQLVADAVVALLVLFISTSLSVYKPQGLTPYGRQIRHNSGTHSDGIGMWSGLGTTSPRWGYAFGIFAVVLFLLFVIIHLAGGGHGHH